MVTAIYFILFLIFAVPTQITLRRKPKQFSVKYLLTYIIIAYIGSIIFSIVLFSSSFVFDVLFLLELLKMAIYNAAVFWVLDSLILRDDYIL